jgi:hypothetical protein
MTIQNLRPIQLLSFAFIALIGIAYIDYITPDFLYLFILYLSPVAIVALYLPIRYGVSACVAASLLWGVANYSNHEVPISTGIFIWDVIARFITMFLFVSLLRYMRLQLHEMKCRVEFLKKMNSYYNEISGFRRICDRCQKVQTEDKEWIPIRTWLAQDGRVSFEECSCPECMTKK